MPAASADGAQLVVLAGQVVAKRVLIKFPSVAPVAVAHAGQNPGLTQELVDLLTGGRSPGERLTLADKRGHRAAHRVAHQAGLSLTPVRNPARSRKPAVMPRSRALKPG
jgi:hypothetical protein